MSYNYTSIEILFGLKKVIHNVLGQIIWKKKIMSEIKGDWIYPVRETTDKMSVAISRKSGYGDQVQLEGN